MVNYRNKSFQLLDIQSKEFIKGFVTKYSLPENYIDLKIETLQKVSDLLQTLTIEEFIEMAFDKMIKGAIEHGVPIHPENFLVQQIIQEILDIPIWNEMRAYNKNKKLNK